MLSRPTADRRSFLSVSRDRIPNRMARYTVFQASKRVFQAANNNYISPFRLVRWFLPNGQRRTTIRELTRLREGSERANRRPNSNRFSGEGSAVTETPKATRRGFCASVGAVSLSLLGSPATARSTNGRVVFIYDDSPEEDYTQTFPVHRDEGVPGCIAAVSTASATRRGFLRNNFGRWRVTVGKSCPTRFVTERWGRSKSHGISNRGKEGVRRVELS